LAPAILLGLTLLSILAFYHFNRTLRIDVGDFGDAPFVYGFNADEADLDYRYRWSEAQSEVRFTGAGSARPAGGSVRLQAPRPAQSASFPVTLTLSINGVVVEPSVTTANQQLKEYHFVARGVPASDAPMLSFSTSTFAPPGDARQLGVKVDQVELRQESSGLNLPPWWMLFWPAVLVSGVYGLVTPVREKPRKASKLIALAPPIAASALAILILLVLLALNSLYVAAYLPPFATIMGLVGLLTWQRHRIWRWPRAVDALGLGPLAQVFMVSALLIYAGVSIWTIPQVEWIGHADYAENAVVARNFVQGRGLTVDYIAQFYKSYEDISHPAETWPLLQPLLIAPFFAIFDSQTWAAKLPNLFIMLGLGWAVFAVASRLWDARVGLFAGLLTLVHPYFFTSVLYPINDLGFTLIFFLLAWLVWRQVSLYGRAQASARPAPGQRRRRLSQSQTLLLTGALAGLLIWSKPSGAILVVGLVAWVIWTWWRVYKPEGRSVPWRKVALPVAAFTLVLLPLVIRNMLAFQLPYFTTESYDAWILRYWNGDQTLWENIYKVYVGSELPHPRWVVGGKFGYDTLLDAVGRNFRWVWDRGIMGAPGEGDYVVGLLPLVGALIGLASATRRASNLFGMVGLSLGLYSLFVMLYWHFEGRYFQVAVPWLYMLLAWGVFWLWDHLRRALSEGMGRTWGLLLLPLAVLTSLWPSVSTVLKQVETDTRPVGFVATMRWLEENSTPEDVVMTRDPWELNWHARRKAVMIPYDDLQTIERIAREYGVTMLQLGGPVDRVDITRCPDDPASVGPFPTGSRPALGPLYCGRELPGYRLVFKQGGGTIYRLEKP
jgi:hypothetical protein